MFYRDGFSFLSLTLAGVVAVSIYLGRGPVIGGICRDAEPGYLPIFIAVDGVETGRVSTLIGV